MISRENCLSETRIKISLYKTVSGVRLNKGKRLAQLLAIVFAQATKLRIEKDYFTVIRVN